MTGPAGVERSLRRKGPQAGCLDDSYSLVDVRLMLACQD
jgi:hypothetical protein